MKKVLSFLLSVLIIAGIAALFYFRPPFATKQIDKVYGMYFVYKGDKEFKKRHLQKAIDNYNRGLQLYPGHYGAWNNLGSLYVLYEDYFSAVEAYEQAFTHNPKFMQARMNYGVVSAERLGDFDGAIAQYQAILDTKPRLISIPFIFNNRRSTKLNRGLAYYNMGVAYKQKSIYLDDAQEFRRKYLLAALDAYKRAVKILKKDYAARYNLALTYHLLDDYHDAGLNYCKAIELAPMNYDAHYNLAILLRHLAKADKESARKYYKAALDEMQKATGLISSSDGFSNRQRYVFDVMNEMTRMLYTDKNSQYFVERLDDEPQNHGVTYVNGKLVATDDLDRAILKNLKTCGSKKIFTQEITKDYEEPRGRAKVPNIDSF
ncbi:MAG: tetratricopeptide repeat protein [Heliobacteriaceae bacterium]|jgi:tetratricopeptide (TPR) repeat protein|nr:tetratricopeptide repeat protein [Heliobacteriaceae bacterium]